MTVLTDHPAQAEPTAVRPPHPTPRQRAGSHPTAVLASIVAGAVATIGLWWHEHPVHQRARRLAHQRRPDHRAARGLRHRRPGRADGAAPAARARRRRRPAGPLARDGRALRREPRRRACAAHHLGLRRRPRTRASSSETEHAAAELSRRADGDRRAGCCSSVSASCRPAPPAAGCDTRPGTTCTSTPTWRSRWPSATSSPTAPSSSRTRAAESPGRALYVGVGARHPVVPVRRPGALGASAPDGGRCRAS